MSEPPVLVDRAQAYWTITLNRPDKLNAFNAAMHAGLQEALREAEADPACRALILTGAGRAFCAGQDLDERMVPEGGTPPDLGATIEAGYNPLIRRLRALPIPIVAAVNGVAAGAGANVALACDIVLAARSARFIQAFAKIGLIPDSGGTWLLPRLVGSARARALALLAEPVTAEQAEAWGMIWRCVEDERLMPDATALARQLAEGPTFGLGLIKQALERSSGNTLVATARCRARPAAGGGALTRLRRGGAGLPREAPATLHRAEAMTVPGSGDPHELARACAEAMWAEDAASQGLGMRIESVGPRRSPGQHGDPAGHGEWSRHRAWRPDLRPRRIRPLPLPATAMASGSWPSTARSPSCARPGSATGSWRRPSSGPRSGRSGIYDIRVSDGTGTLVAEFRGHSRSLGQSLLDPAASAGGSS